jgi:hypothetical protein
VSRKERKLHAVGEMEVGPPEPLCKRRLQTAISCSGRKTAVVNVMVKRRGFISSLMESGVDFVCCDNPHATKLTLPV